MVDEETASCVESAAGPISQSDTEGPPQTDRQSGREAPKMSVGVGKPAPDFEASAFVDGGFKNIKLSDYKGQWVVLCFYPGDFTFV